MYYEGNRLLDLTRSRTNARRSIKDTSNLPLHDNFGAIQTPWEHELKTKGLRYDVDEIPKSGYEAYMENEWNKQLKALGVYKKKPPKGYKLDRKGRVIKGGHIISELYAMVYACAKKNSGKTTVLYTMLKACCGKNTKVFIFSSTIDRDKSWRRIISHLDVNNIQYKAYRSIYSDDGKRDYLSETVAQIMIKAERKAKQAKATERKWLKEQKEKRHRKAEPMCPFALRRPEDGLKRHQKARKLLQAR